MKKSELLRLMRLLSAIESWGVSQDKRMPDYLHDDLSIMLEAIEKSILGLDLLPAPSATKSLEVPLAAPTAKYELELRPLLDWVVTHPGLTISGLERTLKALPWPSGDPSTWQSSSHEGTRLSAPSAIGLSWKLRYMELSGDVRCEGNRWYATMDNTQVNTAYSTNAD